MKLLFFMKWVLLIVYRAVVLYEVVSIDSV